MIRLRRARPLVLALLLTLPMACGGGESTDTSFTPRGPIVIAPFGQGPITTSPTNRFVIPHGTSTSFHVSEDIYTGTYKTTVVTNPPSSTCITVPPESDYVFTVSASGDPACTYPQTADITFTDRFSHTMILYVQGT